MALCFGNKTANLIELQTICNKIQLLSKNNMIGTINDTFEKKCMQPSIKDLKLSGHFSVSLATVGITASFERQMVRRQ